MGSVKHKIYYTDKAGIVVDARHFRTRHRDQALGPITSVRIGREPLLLSLGAGIGLLLFTWRSGDLLYIHEQLLITALAVILLAGGYSVASLQMGSAFHERTMLWSSLRRIRRIREAVIEARKDQAESPVAEVILDPDT